MVEHRSPKPRVVGSNPTGPAKKILKLGNIIMVAAKKDISHVKKSPRKPSFSTNPSIELKKVTWPNRDTLIKSTVLILALVIVLTSYVSGLDLIFSKLFYMLRGQT